ncbi:hypothetical protein PUN28_014312 [Cardiocondyla obscurior]|uniref:Uncharacterized protein n=1 Tax=Cardiocondyla obscurior TaxID=286306 RepID=A0AAW2F3P9_9HYME
MQMAVRRARRLLLISDACKCIDQRSLRSAITVEHLGCVATPNGSETRARSSQNDAGNMNGLAISEERSRYCFDDRL